MKVVNKKFFFCGLLILSLPLVAIESRFCSADQEYELQVSDQSEYGSLIFAKRTDEGNILEKLSLNSGFDTFWRTSDISNLTYEIALTDKEGIKVGSMRAAERVFFRAGRSHNSIDIDWTELRQDNCIEVW